MTTEEYSTSDILAAVKDADKEMIYRIERQGWIKPKLVGSHGRKAHLYSKDDAHLISEIAKYIKRGFDYAAAWRIATRKEHDMTTAVLFFKTSTVNDKVHVLEAIMQFSGLAIACPVYGRYDIVALGTWKEQSDLDDLINKSYAGLECSYHLESSPQRSVGTESAKRKVVTHRVDRAETCVFMEDGYSARSDGACNLLDCVDDLKSSADLSSAVAFVRLTSRGDPSRLVEEVFHKSDAVRLVARVHGAVSAVAIVTAAARDELDVLVLEGLRGLDSVEDTETLIAMNRYLRWAQP